MLIYNFQKEFIGIGEKDLTNLGFSNLAEFQTQISDLSDLFVKTPGFIHNFKHIHWIDYIICNESNMEAKAVISIRDKNYVVSINIETLYLVDNPSQKAYIVNLSKITPVSTLKDEELSLYLKQKPEAVIEQSGTKVSSKAVISNDVELTADTNSHHSIETDKDMSINIKSEKTVDKKRSVSQQTTDHDIKDDPFASYVYNPKIASDELGLPIDLVEEFIQDFIAQANSFKDGLYKAIKSEDLDTLKIQSHKLKGVAANLRIEDAFDALKTINTSDDKSEIIKNLNNFYTIINKLSNEKDLTHLDFFKDENQEAESKIEIIEDRTTQIDKNSVDNLNNKTAITDNSEDDLIISIKEDAPSEHQNNSLPKNKTFLEPETETENIMKIDIDDSQVPESIEIPELADDEFFKQKNTTGEDEVSDEDLSILDNYDSALEMDIYKYASDNTFTYDKKKIAQDIGLNIESFNELFEDYLKEAKELASSMLKSVDDNNLESSKKSAVKLKKMSENMRIYDFDNAVESIIDSTNTLEIKKVLQDIVLKLNTISNHKE